MCESGADWGSLLEKVLIQIFEHLTADDIKEAGLSCKHWFEVSSRPDFLRSLKVLVYNQEHREKWPGKTKVPSVLRLMAGSSRNFEWFHCERVKLDGKNGDVFWEKFAPVITRLAFVDCQIESQYLVQLLQKMPNLRRIDFCDMDYSTNWRMRDFDCLKSKWNIPNLNWAGVNQITEVMFNAIFGMTNSSLERFRLSVITPNMANMGMTTIFDHLQFKDQCLKVETFKKFLLRHQNNLKSIELNEKGPFQFTVKALLKAPSLTLNKVTLLAWPADVSSGDLNAFMWNQKKLQSIYLAHMPNNNETLWAISEMADMKDLSIQQSVMSCFSDEGLELLRKLKKLESLTLHNFGDITTKGFNRFFEGLDVSKIRYLNLSRFEKLEGTSFHETLPRMTNLTCMFLENCNHLIDDKVLLVVFESLVKLENVTLEGLQNVSKAAFFGEFGISNLRRLKTLSLTKCPIFADDCLDTIDGLKALKCVALSQCPKVTNAGLKSFLRRFPGFVCQQRDDNDIVMKKNLQVSLEKPPFGFQFVPIFV